MHTGLQCVYTGRRGNASEHGLAYDVVLLVCIIGVIMFILIIFSTSPNLLHRL